MTPVAPEAGVAPEPFAPMVLPLVWDGSTDAAVWVCEWDTVRGCHGRNLQEGENMRALDVPGAITAASLTLTWDAGSALMDRLRFGLVGMRGEGEDMEHVVAGVAEGTSPLTLQVDTVDAAPGMAFHLFVISPARTSGPVFAFVSQTQAFHVEGTLTVQPGEAPADPHAGHGM